MTPYRRNKGFGLVEMLLALMIMGMLLTAIAAAIHASLRSYDQNNNLADICQAGRSVLSRISYDIRTADAVKLDDTSNVLTLIRPPDSAGVVKRIQYDYSNGLLYYRVIINGTATINEVIMGTANDVGVTAFSKSVVTGLNVQGLTCAKTVTVRLSMLQDNQAQSMTISASPRRNQSL